MGIYNGALAVILILGAPVWILLVLANPRLRAGFLERLQPLPQCGEANVWVHAASVGEVEAIAPLIRELRQRRIPLQLTALSDTGRARLCERFPECAPRLAPLDLPWLARASVRRARVTGLILVETELWPNLLAAIAKRGGHGILVSARLSDRSFPRYRRMRRLLTPLLRRLSAVAARSAVDRERFVELGVSPECVRVVGDLKWARPELPGPGEALVAALGSGPFLLAASTHEGEEDAVLEAFRGLRDEAPELRLVIAPRHPPRSEHVAARARAAGFEVGLRSRGAAREPVVVLDTLGELASLYSLATLVFSGGSLVPIGGHNLVEIVQSGRVAVVGPHTQNQAPQVALLEPTGALVRVADAKELGAALRRLWRDPSRDAPVVEAKRLCSEQARALDRVLEWLENLEVIPHGTS